MTYSNMAPLLLQDSRGGSVVSSVQSGFVKSVVSTPQVLGPLFSTLTTVFSKSPAEVKYGGLLTDGHRTTSEVHKSSPSIGAVFFKSFFGVSVG